jgi:kinesin family protein 11
MEEQFKTLRQLFKDLASGDEAESQLFDGLQEALEQAHSEFEEQLTDWGKGVKETVQRTCGEATVTVTQHTADIGKAVDTLQVALESIVRQAKTFVEEQRKLVAEIKEYANAQAQVEIARLKKQNQLLNQMVANERSKANAAKDDLVKRVTGLLDNFLQERDESLKVATKGLQRENDGMLKATEAEFVNHGKTYDTAEARIHAFDGVLQQNTRENKRKRDMISKVGLMLFIPFVGSLNPFLDHR